MDGYLAMAAVLGVGALTPGPNNFIVLRQSARFGAVAAGPVIAGVLLGSTVLLVAAWFGAESVFEAAPALRPVLRLAASAWLVWLGVGVLRSAGKPDADQDAAGMPTTLAGVAGFQLLNPKGWMTMLALVAMAPAAGGPGAFVVTAGLAAVTMAASLALWALGGAWLGRYANGRWFARAMGTALVLSAAGLWL